MIASPQGVKNTPIVCCASLTQPDLNAASFEKSRCGGVSVSSSSQLSIVFSSCNNSAFEAAVAGDRFRRAEFVHDHLKRKDNISRSSSTPAIQMRQKWLGNRSILANQVGRGSFGDDRKDPFTRSGFKGKFLLATTFLLADGKDIADNIPPQGLCG